MSSKSSTPSPVTGITPKPKKRPRGGQFGAAGVENPSVSRSKDVAASKGKKRANKATSNKKTYKKRRTNNLKKKEEEAEDRRKDVERMRAKLVSLDNEDKRQEKQRQKREIKRKHLRKQLRESQGGTDTEDDGDVVMRSPLSPHQLSTAKVKVVDYITSNIPFVQSAEHVVQVWNYNAEHGAAPRGNRSRSAISAAVKAALVDIYGCRCEGSGRRVTL